MATRDWFLDPFKVFPKIMLFSLQEEIDITAKTQFKNYGDARFWTLDYNKAHYAGLFQVAESFVLPFPTTYLAEREFSSVADVLSKSRNKIDIVGRGDLRLMLSKIEPDVSALVKQHQPQGSH